RLADRLRFVYGHDALPRAVWDSLDRQCRAAWDARDVLDDPEAPRFEEAFEARTRVDLFDLAVLWADLRVRFAGSASEAARAVARRLLQEARELLGPGVLLDELRLLDGDGQGRPKDEDQTPRTAWGHFLLGRSLFRRGELARAATRFEEAIR